MKPSTTAPATIIQLQEEHMQELFARLFVIDQIHQRLESVANSVIYAAKSVTWLAENIQHYGLSSVAPDIAQAAVRAHQWAMQEHREARENHETIDLHYTMLLQSLAFYLAVHYGIDPICDQWEISLEKRTLTLLARKE